MTIVEKWIDEEIEIAKRVNIHRIGYGADAFEVIGRHFSASNEGSWWEMICLARAILASENTKLAAPEWYMPDYKLEQMTSAAEAPYQMSKNAPPAWVDENK